MGALLGQFRNTYYDFPAEAEHEGRKVPLFDRQCKPIAQVPVGFHDAVCVQGSGRLRNGQTVSYARRNCPCARTCPRTQQEICFDALDPEEFPWGRGASGAAITPLRSVAVDSDVIPLGSPLYVPELVGLPLFDGSNNAHDGCVWAQDRGLKIQGNHIDVFAGSEGATRELNQLLPSNRGVRVYLDSPLCRGLIPGGAR